MEKLVRYSHCCYALCISSSSSSPSSSPSSSFLTSLFSSHFAFFARCQSSLFVLLGFAERTARISSFCLLRVCFPDKYISIIDCSSFSLVLSPWIRSSRDNFHSSINSNPMTIKHVDVCCSIEQRRILISDKASKKKVELRLRKKSRRQKKKETLRLSSRTSRKEKRQ